MTLLALLLAATPFWRDDVAPKTPPDGTRSPIVEAADSTHSLVTFVWRAKGPTTGVKLFIQLNKARDPHANMLTRVGQTDVWAKTFLLPNELRLSYGFLPNPDEQSLGGRMGTPMLADPLNPKTLTTGYGNMPSALELPAAPPEPYLTPVAPAGKLAKHTFGERVAYVYTPAGFDKDRAEPYPLLLCFDGMLYGSPDAIPVPIILDNLIAQGKIPPMLAVLVEQGPQRNAELANNPGFVTEVADRLLPSVRKQFHATSDPARTAVCGSSAGGLGSIFAAASRPDVFGNVLAQSAALWRDDELSTKKLAASPKLPIRFVVQVGIVEIVPTPSGLSILDANRHLRDVLQAKGYELHYSEVAGGHEPFGWRGGVAPGLLTLFGSPDPALAVPARAQPK